MNWFNMGGFNPKFKEFADKYPEKTLIGMWWSLHWRPLVIILLLEIIFVAAIAFSGAMAFRHHRDGWTQQRPGDGAPMEGKLNINAVCEGALAYMTFPDAASADLFVQECTEGKHPEVIEQYKADMNLGDGATI